MQVEVLATRAVIAPAVRRMLLRWQTLERPEAMRLLVIELEILIIFMLYGMTMSQE